MSSEIKTEIQLEIGHVLFMDIVDYSTRLIEEQRALRDTLKQIVRNTNQFKAADATGTLIKSPTGDGVALVFHRSAEEPLNCALEISRALKAHPELPLRMGVHSGPVTAVTDVNVNSSPLTLFFKKFVTMVKPMKNRLGALRGSYKDCLFQTPNDTTITTMVPNRSH